MKSTITFLFFALVLCACATQTEPPPVATAPAAQRPIAGKYNEAVNADVSCLSAEQQAAYAERRTEMVKKATESMATALVAASMNSGSIGSANASAARDALKQCENNLPADADKSRSCVAERNAVTPSPGIVAVRQAMLSNAAARMKEAAALRAEFPPCPAKAPSEEKPVR